MTSLNLDILFVADLKSAYEKYKAAIACTLEGESPAPVF